MAGVRKTIMQIAGARPQFIKLAAVSRIVRQDSQLEEIIIHTGQHFDNNMSKVFFEELRIPEPDYNLGIQGTGQEGVVDLMQEKIAARIREINPQWVVVYGDTYSTLAGARAARECGIRLAHVEAGLRSFNNEMPEEFNRIETDRLSDLLLAPTASAVENLNKEGLFSKGQIIKQCGDVMYDAVMFYGALPGATPKNTGEKQFLLCTIHRAENTDNPAKLEQLVTALNTLSEKYQIVFPMHPRTEKRMQSFGLRLAFPTHPPQTYLQIINLLRNCALVLTDSGGLQKEAYFMKKFCVTLRNETEWVELVNAGYNQLAGTAPMAIFSAVESAMSKKGSFKENFYGNGQAANCIVNALKEY